MNGFIQYVRCPDTFPLAMGVFKRLSEGDRCYVMSERFSEEHCSPFHIAAMQPTKSHLSTLFPYARINGVDDEGYTPLSVAIESGCVWNVKFLLRYGADPNYDRTCVHPVVQAVKMGRCDMLELLLKHNGDPNVDDSSPSPLDVILKIGRCDMLTLLLNNHLGCSCEIDEERGMCRLKLDCGDALVSAVESGRNDMTRLILDHPHCTSIDEGDHKSNSLFHIAVNQHDIETFRMLLHHRSFSSINVDLLDRKNERKYSVHDLIKRTSAIEFAKSFIDVVNDSNVIPKVIVLGRYLHFMVYHRQYEYVEKLLKMGDYPNRVDLIGTLHTLTYDTITTPLNIAATLNDERMILLLVSHGGKYVRGREGNAIVCAMENSWDSMVLLLLTLGYPITLHHFRISVQLGRKDYIMLFLASFRTPDIRTFDDINHPDSMRFMRGFAGKNEMGELFHLSGAYLSDEHEDHDLPTLAKLSLHHIRIEHTIKTIEEQLQKLQRLKLEFNL